MNSSQHNGAVLWSLALHVAVIAGILVGIPWRGERVRVPIAASAPIQGTIIDQAAIEREQAAREEAARQERQRQQREERQRREAAEQERAEQQRERQRVANEQLAREQAAQKERDRVAAEKSEQARKEREREAQAQRDKEAAEKRAREQAEQRRRQQAESELQQQLALEAEQNAARAAGLYDQYVRAIEQRIKGKWQRPLSARAGIDCVVTVVQLPTGDVVSAKVASCNGDEAVRRSIERAVLDASPLPKAPTPALFERIVNVRFQPEE